MKLSVGLSPAASTCRCARTGAYSILLWLWQSRWIIQYYNEWSVRNIQLHCWGEWFHSVYLCLTMRCSYWLRWGFLLSSYYNVDLRQMQKNRANGELKFWKLRNYKHRQQEGSMGFKRGRQFKCPGFFFRSLLREVTHQEGLLQSAGRREMCFIVAASSLFITDFLTGIVFPSVGYIQIFWRFMWWSYLF